QEVGRVLRRAPGGAHDRLQWHDLQAPRMSTHREGVRMAIEQRWQRLASLPPARSKGLQSHRLMGVARSKGTLLDAVAVGTIMPAGHGPRSSASQFMEATRPM